MKGIDAFITAAPEAAVVPANAFRDSKRKPADAEKEMKKAKETTVAPKKAAKQKKDPNLPKNPPTPYFLFMADFKPEFKKANPQSKGISEATKKKWNGMSDKEKEPYSTKAALLKVEYAKELAAYQFKVATEASANSEITAYQTKVATEAFADNNWEISNDAKQTEGTEDSSLVAMKGTNLAPTAAAVPAKNCKRKPTSAPKEKKPKNPKETSVAEKDPNLPMMPHSAYTLFIAEFIPAFSKANPESRSREAMEKGIEKWKEMSEKEKEPYNTRSALLKDVYGKELEAYKNKIADEASGDTKSEIADVAEGAEDSTLDGV